MVHQWKADWKAAEKARTSSLYSSSSSKKDKSERNKNKVFTIFRKRDLINTSQKVWELRFCLLLLFHLHYTRWVPMEDGVEGS